MDSHDLVDIWRQHHTEERSYTWRRADGSQASRLDMFWLSSSFLESVAQVDIFPFFHSDHSYIYLKLTFPSLPDRGPGDDLAAIGVFLVDPLAALQSTSLSTAPSSMQGSVALSALGTPVADIPPSSASEGQASEAFSPVALEQAGPIPDSHHVLVPIGGVLLYSLAGAYLSRRASNHHFSDVETSALPALPAPPTLGDGVGDSPGQSARSSPKLV